MTAKATKIVPLRDLLQFCGEVAAMRDAQRRAGAKDHKLAAPCQSLEREVDARVKELTESQYTTGSLFVNADASGDGQSPPAALVEAAEDCVRMMKRCLANDGVDMDELIGYVVAELELRSKNYREWK
jgi:hypothetical protein